MDDFTDKEILQFAKAKLKFKNIDGEMCLNEVNTNVMSVCGDVNVVQGYVDEIIGGVGYVRGDVKSIRGKVEWVDGNVGYVNGNVINANNSVESVRPGFFQRLF